MLQKHVSRQESSSLTVHADENSIARKITPRIIEGINRFAQYINVYARVCLCIKNIQ